MNPAISFIQSRDEVIGKTMTNLASFEQKIQDINTQIMNFRSSVLRNDPYTGGVFDVTISDIRF